MSKSRDIADSAATINYIDNVTSDVQSQLNTLTTAIDNVSVTSGTLTKTFTTGESSTINLTSSVLAPVVSVTKEVPQSGVTNNNWDVNSTTENYTRLDSAYDTTLDWVGFDIGGASFVDSFSVSAQETGPTAIAFSTDGTKMFIAGSSGDDVNEYTLSAGFDVSTASFVDSFSVASQDTSPQGLTFNSDGTKMFVVGAANDSVYQYGLSTGFDVSTASYSQSFSVTAQETDPKGIAFNTDGTKMFVGGGAGDDINEYALGTGFDVSTASFVDSFSVTAQDTNPTAIFFNTDGTKMFVCGQNGQDVNAYTLTTGFDVSTASYSQNFSVAAQENNPRGLAFNNDGTKMFIVGVDGQDVNEYTVGRSLALGTGSFASADVGKTIEANSGAFVLTATDGSNVETTAPTSYDQVASGSWEMYGVVYNAADGDLELSALSSVFDIAGASYDSVSLNVSGLGGSPVALRFNNDGTKLIVIEQQTRGLYQYNLTTAFDISTATYGGIAFSVASQDIYPNKVIFNPDGTKMYVCGGQNNNTYQYSLSVPFNVSSASYDSVFIDHNPQTTGFESIEFNNDGSVLFASSPNTDAIYEYSLPTPYNLSSASFVKSSSSLASQDAILRDFYFNKSGSKLYVLGGTGDSVFQYSLSTNFDISTISYDAVSFNTTSQDNTPYGFGFNSAGDKMYVIGIQNDSVYQYSTGLGVFFTTGYQPVHTTQSIDSTYWTDINSMTADQNAGDGNVYYAISTDDRTTWTVIDNTDGERDIVRNNAGTWQYNSNGTYASETWVNGATNTELATLAEAMEGAVGVVGAFDVSTAVYSQNFSVSAQETDAQGLAFSADGTKMFVVGTAGDDVNEYALSTGFDVATAVYSQNFSISGQETEAQGIAFNTDGTKMFVVGNTGDDVNEYTLSTGFDVSTASFTDSFSVASQDTFPTDLAFNTDGTKMFIVGLAGDAVYEYALTTGFDVSTASFTDNFSVASQDTNPMGLTFNSDGSKMFIAGWTGDDINEYALTTGFDVSTASFVDSFSVVSQSADPKAVAFNTNGSKMFVLAVNVVYEYNVGSTAYINQMDKTQLDAVTDPNHIALGDDLDLAIIFNMTSGSTVPSSDGVAINYDANVLNKGAVLGTDYDFDAPAGDKVRITAVGAGNYKVRVV